MIPFPKKKYDIIYADPAWSYKNKMLNPFREKLSPSAAKDHYDTMEISELKGLPVKKISAENALLFLWVSSPNLPYCIEVGESWGFRFTTVAFVWDKERVNPGSYTMSQCELCLAFKRGTIPKPRGARNIRQLIRVKRGKHSVKPLVAQKRITDMFPDQKKIELFARDVELVKMDGWDYWGDQV